MNRALALSCALVGLASPAPPLFSQARDATCYVLVKEGASSEGNQLYLQKMGLDPELLSRVAPTRFTFSGKSFDLEASGNFSYEAQTPILVERSGSVVLYSVALKFTAGSFPAALKTVAVSFGLSDIVKGGEAVQPAAKAMQLAAAKAGMKTGMAWIEEMTMPARGEFRARVSLAK